MKIGFTSRVCPEWDLSTMVRKAVELGFDGIELAGAGPDMTPPALAELTSDPAAARALCADHKIELVCMGAGETLDSWSVPDLAERTQRVLAAAMLAEQVGCPMLRMPIGEMPQGDNRDRTLTRLASTIGTLAPALAERDVTLLVENGGGFPGSEDLWFVTDSAGHPAVGACWNPCAAMRLRERPTTAIPRLARSLKLVRVCDGSFDPRGAFGGYRVPGEGDVELERMVDLLRGIMFPGYLMFDWPAAANLPGPDDVLPKVLAAVRAWIDAKSPVLTAYKDDKNPVYLDMPGVEIPPPKAPKVAKPAE